MDKDNKIKINMISANSAAIATPTFKSMPSKEYIQYGELNQYPSILRELMNGSTKHASLLNKKANMTSSKGFDKEGMDLDVKLFVANPDGSESLDDIAFKNSYDLVLYGGYTVAVTWSKDKSKIARVQYVDFSHVRIIKELNDDSDISKLQEEGVESYLISSDWTQEKKPEYTPKYIQGFSNENKNETTQLIYVTQYRPGCDSYPLPDYISGANYIAIDNEISTYHLSAIQNGFAPSFMLNLTNVSSDEEMKDFERKFTKKYQGSTNASKMLMTVSETPEQRPELIPITLDSSDERYRDLEEQTQKNIIIAHQASSPVAGIETAGKLGSANEILEAELIFQKNVIDAYQILIEKTYNKILLINGVDYELKLNQAVDFNMDGVVNDEDKPNTNTNTEEEDGNK